MRASRGVLGGTLLVSLIGLISATAVADEKVLPGTICFKTGSSGTLAQFGGTIFNSASGNSIMGIHCPVVRDNPGANFNSIKFDVYDRHSTINMTASLCNEVGTNTGLANNCSTPKLSQGAGPQRQVLTLTSHPANLGPDQYSYALGGIPTSENGNFSHFGRIFIDEQ